MNTPMKLPNIDKLLRSLARQGIKKDSTARASVRAALNAWEDVVRSHPGSSRFLGAVSDGTWGEQSVADWVLMGLKVHLILNRRRATVHRMLSIANETSAMFVFLHEREKESGRIA